ncbi:hypothetical protein [Streptomyces brevispora]|uniref:Alpha-ketoglutarate-dependent dioxygenase AlkB n=1 Tax=Streptomyces brevispora TaxID=887462 RepID=A0A561UQQ5_9ACTN|nr:hypothetical protein FHX80_1167 [Streptomyces brevispora]
MTVLFTPQLPERHAGEIIPGATHVPNWLTPEQQERIADRFHEWARGPVPLRAARVRGHQMSVRTVCLGWHWQPYQPKRNVQVSPMDSDTTGAPLA